jgi:hypothetical protein
MPLHLPNNLSSYQTTAPLFQVVDIDCVKAIKFSKILI